MVTNATPVPREQQGAYSQQLLTVLLGDYWYGRSEPVPSGALVEMLGIFDVSAAGARAAIQRLAQRGFLRVHRSGRSTAYEVAATVHSEIVERLAALFMAPSRAPWNGEWTVVAYSLPETARASRNVLRDHLRRHRFGNLYDGLWVRPGDCTDQMRDIREALGDDMSAQALTFFVSARIPDEADLVTLASTAFDLPTVAAGYRAFITRWEDFAEDRRAGGGRGEQTAEQALRTRTVVMREWRELRHSDPRLPDELLPDGYPLAAAAALSAFLYNDLGPQAELAFREVLARYDEELAAKAAHHSFHQLARLGE